MNHSSPHLRILSRALLLALLFSANFRSNARNLNDSGEGDSHQFISAGNNASRNHVLTTASGQRVARVAVKPDKLKLSPIVSGLPQSRQNFQSANSRLFLVTDDSASYDSVSVFSVGGRDPPTAI